MEGVAIGPVGPGGAPGPPAPQPGAAPHLLGSDRLPPTVATSLLQQAAVATAPGQLVGVQPPAQFLGANPSNSRLSFGAMCQRFIDQDWQPHGVPPRQAVVYAFRNEHGVQLAEFAADPADRGRRSRWKGSFSDGWSRGFAEQHRFIKVQAKFRSKDGQYEVRPYRRLLCWHCKSFKWCA